MPPVLRAANTALAFLMPDKISGYSIGRPKAVIIK